MQAEKSTPPAPTAEVPSPAACENCGAPLYGKYCYACGQPIHGLVRHFGSVLSDVADSLFNIDDRLFRTLSPLYLRPGKLTLDYFAGKRARYVTPFRLVFFLAIIAFFAIQLSVRSSFREVAHVPAATATGPGNVAAAINSADDPFTHGSITFDNGWTWNRQTHPLDVRWLPPVANDWLNDELANAQQQLRAMNSGSSTDQLDARRKFMLHMVANAPTVLFLLLPFFALLLKVSYIFKKRLYMEHLIVAMHSHAFLMLSMLVLSALAALRGWIVPHAGWLGVPFGLLAAAAWIWLFTYLFVMQKRVYRQGWFMTTLKYCCVGFWYSILLGFGFGIAAVLSLTSA